MEIDSTATGGTDRWLPRLGHSPLRGLAVSAVSGLLLSFACLLSWANVHILVLFDRTYAGTHFGEGRVALGLGVAAAVAAALAASVLRPALFALPLLGAAALSLTSWKYHEIGTAFDPSHRFPIGSASAGAGIVLAIVASALLLAGGAWAVADQLRGVRIHVTRAPSERS